MRERWKPVPGYSQYIVSDYGRVRGPNGLLKPFQRKGNGPYWYVGLGRGNQFKVARLVLMAFAGLPKGKRNHSRHLDDDKQNDRLTNLKWGTIKDNADDRIHNGKASRKLTPKIVRQIKFEVQTQTRRALGKKYGVTHSTITHIVTGRTWDHVRH